MALGIPHPARSKGGDDLALIATGMAAHEHLAVFGIRDGRIQGFGASGASEGGPR
jgi:hypothetical protein